MNVEKEKRICLFCEYAVIGKEEDADSVFCQKKKRQVLRCNSCLRFSYDLLKRNVSPLPEVPMLDPSIFDGE